LETAVRAGRYEKRQADLLSYVLQQVVNHPAVLLGLKPGVKELEVENREKTRDFVVSQGVK
jgi:hypothetical protein